MSYFIQCHGCLKISKTKMWKKLHYLIGQFFEILLCNLISPHALFHKARWMLVCDPLFLLIGCQSFRLNGGTSSQFQPLHRSIFKLNGRKRNSYATSNFKQGSQLKLGISCSNFESFKLRNNVGKRKK